MKFNDTPSFLNRSINIILDHLQEKESSELINNLILP